MRALVLAAAAALLAASASAQTQARTVHVAVKQTVTLDEAGGTATWAVDPAVAEATIRFGRVAVSGRAAGKTVVSVVTPAGVHSYEVVVDAPVTAPTASAAGSKPRQQWTALQGGYDSATSRATTSLDIVDQKDGRTRRVRVTAVTQTDRVKHPGEAPVSIPSASIEFRSPGTSVVLLDDFVEYSPLTVDGLSVRGLHVSSGPLRIHAGFASSLLYDDLFLPATAERVAGLGLALGRGTWSVTPGVFYFPDASATRSRGAVGSLLLQRGRETDALRLTAEAGYGGRWGGAAELAADGGHAHLRLRGRYQPTGFASLSLGQPHGTFADGAGTLNAGRLTVTGTGAFSRYELPLSVQRTEAATGNLRLRVAGNWFLTGGGSLGWFDSAGARVRSLSLPGGVAYEGPRAGVSLLYRHQENSATNFGGSGGRLGLRASGRRLRGSAFVDAQRDAPTVDFVLRSEPRLARLLAELGLSAQSPEDIARILSEQAPLVAVGYLQGVSVSLHPWRVQGGGDLLWSLTDSGREQLRLHVLVDRTQAIAGRRDTTLATLSYSQTIGSTELTAGYTWTATDMAGLFDQGSSFQVALRTRFDGVPQLGGGVASIAGIVFADEEATGAFTPGMPALAGTRVRLDGSRLADSDARGRFRFDGVGGGAHTVEALLPATDGAFFTTPSSVTVPAGATVSFGIGTSPARLTGFVRDDAGRGVAGVTVRLQREGHEVAATSDSSGRYAFATAAGDYVAQVDPASLPSGYDAAALRATPVQLRPASPARLDHAVRAQRALSGRVLGKAAARTVVRLVELGLSVEAAEDGGYAFRNLKPGRYTVSAVVGGRSVSRRVQVPETPGVLRDVDLDPARPVS